MPQQYISTLTQEEQHELALCGVTQDVQLAQADPRRLMAELELATKLLPNTTKSLTEARLQHICRQARGETVDALAEPRKQPKDWGELPITRIEHQTSKTRTKGIDRHHAAHPFALVFAAALLLLLVAATAGMIIIGAYGALTGEIPPLPLGLLLGIYVVLWASYLLAIHKARCVICRGVMCSIFSSKRSVHAHYIPILGHTIPAAFSILFTLRTICPHCGTLQLIIGGARPRHSQK